MTKDKSGRWFAVTPMDLIGWEIVDGEHNEDTGLFKLEVQTKGMFNKQSRTVYATDAAVPLWVLQMKTR